MEIFGPYGLATRPAQTPSTMWTSFDTDNLGYAEGGILRLLDWVMSSQVTDSRMCIRPDDCESMKSV